MTFTGGINIQRETVETAWKKARGSKERIKRTSEALASTGLSRADENRMRELDQQYREAVNADTRACDELEAAMRAVGLNI